MQPSPAKFPPRAIKASWWLGTASLAFGLLIKITSELLEHEASGVDRTILIGLAKARTPWLTAGTSPEKSLGGLHLDPAGVVAVDLTAWGPVTLVVLSSAIEAAGVRMTGATATQIVARKGGIVRGLK